MGKIGRPEGFEFGIDDVWREEEYRPPGPTPGKVPTSMRIMPGPRSTRSQNGAGSQLPGRLQARLGDALGADLGGVRIHTDADAGQAARAMQASAFTHQQDIYFAPGRYQPDTALGQRLIAHEVAHTVQQSRGAADIQARPEVSTRGDASEVEAETFAQAFIRGQGQRVPIRSASTGNGPLIQRDDDSWPTNLPSMTFSSAPDIQERNWSSLPAQQAPDDPPEYGVQIRSHMPAAPQQESNPWAAPERCHPNHHQQAQPDFDMSGLEDAERERFWQAWTSTVAQLGATWNAMRPHVQQFNLTTEQNRQVLDRVYDIRVPDHGNMSSAANAQPAGSAGESGHRRENPVTVGQMFNSAGEANLGRGGERGLRRAAGPVTTQRRAAEAADARVESALHDVRAKASAITTGQLSIEIELNARETSNARNEADDARTELHEAEEAKNAAKEAVRDLKSLIVGVAKMEENPAEGVAEIGEVVASRIIDVAYDGQLTAAKARVAAAVSNVRRHVSEDHRLRIHRAHQQLETAYSQFASSRDALRAALTTRREAYDQLGQAAARHSGTHGETSNRIRGAIAAIPIVETLVATLHNGLDASNPPTYSSASGRGYGIAVYHSLPHVAQFQLRYGQLLGYHVMFAFEYIDWNARLSSLRQVMQTLRGNREGG